MVLLSDSGTELSRKRKHHEDPGTISKEMVKNSYSIVRPGTHLLERSVMDWKAMKKLEKRKAMDSRYLSILETVFSSRFCILAWRFCFEIFSPIGRRP